MKYSLFVIILCLSLNIRASDSFSVYVNPHDLGAWAYKQHCAISSLVHQSINDDKILPLAQDGKYVRKEEALRLFETINYDYSRFFVDSTIYMPVTNAYWFSGFHSFSVDEIFFKIRVFKTSELISFDKKDFFKLLNEEQLVYLDHYTDQHIVLTNSIPVVSLQIINNINKRLFTTALNTSKKTSTDSFSGKTSETHLANIEVIAFIYTDPDDSTIGRDTVFQIMPSLSDSMQLKSLFYYIDIKRAKLRIMGISCGFHPIIDPKLKLDRFPQVFTCAYRPYDTAAATLDIHQELMEYCLGFCMVKQMDPYFKNIYNAYLQRFNLWQLDKNFYLSRE